MFQAGLSSLFAALQALQVIILLPLLDSKMPANTGMVFKTMSKIAAFDKLNIEGIFEINDVFLE